MEQGKLLVLKSSAGSGKTHALVSEYLRLALGNASVSSYRHILAITFTNAAASEMKERVLKKLRGFAGGSGHTDFDAKMAEELAGEVGISLEELRMRSGKVFNHMLHHYGLLSISTIDSFVHRILRAFTRELQLAGDFSISTDASEFHQEVVDQCLKMVGNDPLVTGYLTRFVLDNLEDEKDWSIRKQLEEFAKLLVEEQTIENLDAFRELDLTAFSAAKKTLDKSIAAYRARVRELCLPALDLITQHNIPHSTFPHQRLPEFLKKNASGDITSMSRWMSEHLAGGILHKKKDDKDIIQRVKEITPHLVEMVMRLNDLLEGEERKRYEIQCLVVKGINATGLLGLMRSIGQELRKEKKILLISDFHPLILEIVQDNDAPFIYEKSGERYRHILFDEFQDTSSFQWKNFLPLIQNSLSEGHSNLVVGDGKQAIYRWRNGNVDQFINLPDVPGMDHGASELFRSAYEEKELNTNFRSGSAIVEFNNHLFEHLKGFAGKYSVVYDQVKQYANNSYEGMVVTRCVAGSDGEERNLAMLAQIREYIDECIADGYRGSDIAILTRKKDKESYPIAQYLQDAGIASETSESFLLAHSPSVQFLVLYLRHIITPADQANRVLMAEILAEIFPSKIDFSSLHGSFGTGRRHHYAFDIDTFFKTYFPKTALFSLAADTMYDTLHQLVAAFELTVDEYLEYFLDTINTREAKGQLDLAGFADWWQTHRDKLYIGGTPDPDAVRIMTVHKSKGLQFPVVIYPRFNSRKQSNRIWIHTDPGISPLPMALVKSRNSTEWTPPEFSEEEEKQELDDINLAYVACTRAEDRLYLLVENEKEQPGKGVQRLNDHLYAYLSRGEQPATERMESGKREAPVHSVTKQLKEENVRLLNPEFSLNAPADRKEKWFTTGQAALEGELVHHALSVYTDGDGMDVLREKILGQWELDETTMDRCLLTALEAARSPLFQRWFNAPEKVKTEPEIIDAAGKVHRPDRIVYFKDRIEVVDFKTGSKQRRYHEQVATYVQLVSNLEKLPVKGFIAYTDLPEVEEVFSDSRA